MPAPTPPRTRRPRRAILLSAAAVALLALLAAAVALDVRDFDRTSGGYTAPYTDYTGEPTDWSAATRTETGFRRSGRVVGSELDCTTGMIRLRVAGISFDFRRVSPRAIAVHAPREACVAAGFSAGF